MPDVRCILGIDPGSRLTGYGLIYVRGRSLEYCASGCIRTSGDALPARLGQIYRSVAELIEQYHPTEFAIENVFLARLASSSTSLMRCASPPDKVVDG